MCGIAHGFYFILAAIVIAIQIAFQNVWRSREFNIAACWVAQI